MVSYAGQWLGVSEGNPFGEVILDLDPFLDDARGFAYLFSQVSAVPSTAVEVVFPNGKRVFKTDVQIHPFDAVAGRIIPRHKLRELFPDTQLSQSAQLQVRRDGRDHLVGKWKTNIGTHGQFNLRRTALPRTSSLAAEPEIDSWNGFKSYVSKLNFRDFVFRGQSQPFPLQTTFHRTKRKDLNRYLQNDVTTLHRSITGRPRHIFDLERPQELGALMNLAQHHGFPTPLLDWTYSPFVAAWFAYSGAFSRNKQGSVRIYSLDRKKFLAFRQFQNLTFSPPHFSILETLAIENDRATPQQGLLTLTNLQDIEGYLQSLEAKNSVSLLKAFDLPAREAKDALNDLAMMGITRSTMMPSIESICLDLKDRLFG